MEAGIRVLESISHCAPKQLAICLPRVVPRLTEASAGTHPKVKGEGPNRLWGRYAPWCATPRCLP